VGLDQFDFLLTPEINIEKLVRGASDNGLVSSVERPVMREIAHI